MNVERRQRRLHSGDLDKENITVPGGDKYSREKRSSLPLQKNTSDAVGVYSQQQKNYQQQQQQQQQQQRRDVNNKTTNISRLGFRSSDDSGISSFQKAPFSVYGDPPASELNNVLQKIKKNAERADKSIRSSYLRDRDRNVLMAIPVIPARPKNRPDKPALKKPIVERPKIVVRPCPEVNHTKAKEQSRTKQLTHLPLGESYHLDYTHDFIDQMMSLDEKKKLSPIFLEKGVTASQRCVIVRYLLKLTMNCSHPSFLTYQAVKIFDFYIDKVNFELEELQTIALASLWIAIKKDLTVDEIPEAWYVVDISGNKKVDPKEYKKSLVQYEQKVLMTLKFEISFAEPFSLLALYTIMIQGFTELEAEEIQEVYYFGSYMVDLSMFLEDFLKVAAVHIAAVAAEISLALVLDKDLSIPSWALWRKEVLVANPTMGKYRLQDIQMDYLRVRLLKAAINSEKKQTDYNMCYKKYDRRRYGAISKNLMYKIKCIERCKSFY